MPLTYPSPEEIATPWPAQPIVWRPDKDYTERHVTEIQQDLQAGRPYLVREVHIQGFDLKNKEGRRYYAPISTDHAWDLIECAEREFNILRTCGLEVAPRTWHVDTHDDRILALSRVAIIDGWDLASHGNHQAQATNRMRELIITRHTSSILSYYTSKTPGIRLQDVANAKQCRYGVPRDKTLSQKAATYLVDIEPIF